MKEEYLYQDLTEKIIGIAMEVHRTLGPGFLEAVYEEALIYELEKAGFTCERQKIVTRIQTQGFYPPIGAPLQSAKSVQSF